MPGVVSPHELLQKLQLIQQEQSLSSCDPAQLGPGLAPRFLGPSQSEVSNTSLNQATAGQKAALQFQVISPQRIPATVSLAMLLSPSVFVQNKSSGELSPTAKGTKPVPSNPAPLKDQVRILSRSQLQATLLHLIQKDSSFLDTIYEAYINNFANGSSCKYWWVVTLSLHLFFEESMVCTYPAHCLRKLVANCLSVVLLYVVVAPLLNSQSEVDTYDKLNMVLFSYQNFKDFFLSPNLELSFVKASITQMQNI